MLNVHRLAVRFKSITVYNYIDTCVILVTNGQ